MSAVGYSRLIFSRPFTPEEHAQSYENKLYWQPIRDQQCQELGITHIEEISVDGLVEDHFYIALTPETLVTWFTESSGFVERRNWLQNFSVQCGNIITFNNPVSTIEVTTSVNDFVSRNKV